MTAVVSWFNQEPNTHPYIICVADSKISGDRGGTLDGAKIFELPIKCRDLTTPYQEVYYQGSIGCAFAGSTLVGFNVYSFLQVAFANLGGRKKDNNRPTHNELCLKAEEALKLYVTSISSPAEILLFGYCPLTAVPFLGVIKTINGGNGIEFVTEITTEFPNNTSCVLLGDYKENIKAMLDAEVEAELKDVWYWRKPAVVLKNIIRSGDYDTIGGNLQIGVCHQNNFHSYSVVINRSDNTAEMKYRNIDFTEDIPGNIGSCMIALNGYMIEPA